MSSGYSYVVLSGGKDEPIRSSVSLHLDSHVWIAVPGAGTAKPHLHIAYGDVSVSFLPCEPGAVTAEDARIARDLAAKAAAYAAEIERLHVASTATEPGGAAA
jgi:hypothetical protein